MRGTEPTPEEQRREKEQRQVEIQLRGLDQTFSSDRDVRVLMSRVRVRRTMVQAIVHQVQAGKGFRAVIAQVKVAAANSHGQKHGAQQHQCKRVTELGVAKHGR